MCLYRPRLQGLGEAAGPERGIAAGHGEDVLKLGSLAGRNDPLGRSVLYPCVVDLLIAAAQGIEKREDGDLGEQYRDEGRPDSEELPLPEHGDHGEDHRHNGEACEDNDQRN